MKRCIFCDSELNDATEPQHIIPKWLGGMFKTNKVTCSKCNHDFGKSIDTSFISKYKIVLQELFPFLRNELQKDQTLDIYSIRHQKQVQVFGSFKHNPVMLKEIDKNGIPKLFTFDHFILKDAKTYIEKKAILVKEIKRIMKIDNFDIKFISDEFELYRDFDSYELKITAFSNDQLRLICKILLEFYAEYLVKSNIPFTCLESENLMLVKNFVLKNNNHIQLIQHGYKTSSNYDELNQIFSFNGFINSQFHHSVLIIGDSERRELWGVVTFFGCESYFVILDNNYKGTSFSVLIQNDVIKETKTKTRFKHFKSFDYSIINRDKIAYETMNINDFYLKLQKYPNIAKPDQLYSNYRESFHYRFYESIKELKVRITDYVELNSRTFINCEFRYHFVKTLENFTELFNLIELRCKKLFYSTNQESWLIIWQRIKTEYLRDIQNLQNNMKFALQNNELEEFAHHHYIEMYKKCKLELGLPLNLSNAVFF